MKRVITFLLVLVSTWSLHAADTPAAAATPVAGFTFVKTLGGISEYTLDSNGLTVLLMPEHSAPVLTFMVTYRVGSRNEVTGTTGATHLLEHLMFKGTEKFNRASGTGVDQLLERTGAIYNATTWLDRTNYYQNMGNEHLALAVEMEADRMRNLWLRDEDRKPEMTVVRNEFERGENNPFQSLIKEIFQAAYVAHPYHHSTIGWRSDIEKVSIEKLREFYDTFYWPNNATVSVIGDFQPADALNHIKKFYGAIPPSPKPIPEVYTEEPPQTGPRRVTVKRSGQLGVVAIGHKICPATHADYAATRILSAILTDGNNSRLYRALTDQSLTTSVQSFAGFNRDPSVHITFAALAPGAGHEQVEKIAVEEIEKLKTGGVTDVEVQSAIAKILADAAFERDGSFAIAGNLNECIASGDWTTYYTIEEATKRVTADDVQRVANTYFNVDQSTTGWFVPIVPTEAAPSPAKPAKAARAEETVAAGASQRAADGPYHYRDPAHADAANQDADRIGALAQTSAAGTSAPASAKIAPNVARSKIAGVDVLAYKTGVKDVVTIRGSLPAGDVFSTDSNAALATLVGMMLDKGTRNSDKYAIAQKLESVGATISFSVGAHMTEFSAKCLKKDVPLVVSLIAEQLREPAFAAEEFDKVKKLFAGQLKRRLESTDARALETFARAVYPAGHPNRQPSTDEFLAAIEKATLDEAKAFHAKHYGPNHLTFVAVGDLDVAQIRTEVGKSFTGWTGGVPVVRAPKATSQDSQKEHTVFMADKPSVSVIIGQTSGLRYRDADYQALRVATAILGSGFTGRLMASVRDKEGLTYGIGSRLDNDTFTDGEWRITATFAPTLLDKGIESTKRQLTQWYSAGVTAEELERRKTNLVGAFKVGLATTDGLAGTLLNAVHRGFEISWLDEYPNQINSLTLEQVNGAVKKYLNPENMFIIKTGTVPGVTSGK